MKAADFKTNGQTPGEKDLERIYQAGLKFLAPLGPEETYTVIVQEAMKLVGAEYGSILLEKNGGLERVYASSTILFQIKARKNGRTHKAFRDQKASVYHVLPKDDPHPLRNKLNVKSVIYIPLSHEHQAVGVLTVLSSKEKAFSQHELEILKLFGSMISLVIKKVQLIDETSRALSARDQFISMVTSEITSPLGTINNFIKQLKQKPSEREVINNLSTEALRLTQAVNELLDIDNVKKGRMEYSWKECSARASIKEALREARLLFPDYKIHFQELLNGEKDLFLGDKNKIRQVLATVIENALRFSTPSSEVVVSLAAQGKNLVIKVMDKGSGIGEKDLEKIFDKFFRSQDGSKGGKGLGLYLTKWIIRQMHGLISISSKLNKGTTVEIKLPKLSYG